MSMSSVSMTIKNILPSNVNWENVSACRKYIMATWATLECLFLAGLIYGWYSLVYVLNDEGIYGELCVEVNATYLNHTQGDSNLMVANSDGYMTVRPTIYHSQATTMTPGSLLHDCTERDEKMGLIFTVATIGMTLGTLYLGYIQDRFGVRVARMHILVIYSVATLCIAFVTTATPWLLFIGAPLLAFAGLPLFITNLQVANLFSGGAAAMIGLMSGSFDASASVQLIVKVLYEGGISRMSSYIFICCLFLVMVSTSTFLLLPSALIPKSQGQAVVIMDQDDTSKTGLEVEKAALVPEGYAVYVSTGACSEGAGVMVTPSNREAEHPAVTGAGSDEAPCSWWDCFTSPSYLLHIFWLSVLQLRIFFYISTLNSWLHDVMDGDHTAVSHLTNVSMYIQYGGLVAAPLIGLLLDCERKRHQNKTSHQDRLLLPAFIPLLLTSSICVLLSLLTLISQPLSLYFVFICFTVYRAFLYGLAASYLQMIFPAHFFGSLYGVMILAAGIFGLLQYACIVWLDLPPQGPFKVNVCLLVVVLLSYIHPLTVWVTCRRARAGNNRQLLNDKPGTKK